MLSWIRMFRATSIFLGVTVGNGYLVASQTLFSVHDPSTFKHGSNVEKSELLSIAKEEFDLSHIANKERALLDEALAFSGVEVENTCEVEKKVDGQINVFFRRMKQSTHELFHPDLGIFNLQREETIDNVESSWRKIQGSYTEYPYPLAEAQVLPKVIPVDLSSIELASQTDSKLRYTASPSNLLFSFMRPQDRILSKDDLTVEFEVDRSTRRMTKQSLSLDGRKKVYRGINIRQLLVDYEFDHDTVADRNVMTSMHHSMSGRIFGLFRPNFAISTRLTYRKCLGEPRTQSYLYESLSAIQHLG